jgi:hypothetical protein
VSSPSKTEHRLPLFRGILPPDPSNLNDVKAEPDRLGISGLVGPDAYLGSVVETTEAFVVSTIERPGDE